MERAAGYIPTSVLGTKHHAGTRKPRDFNVVPMVPAVLGISIEVGQTKPPREKTQNSRFSLSLLLFSKNSENHKYQADFIDVFGSLHGSHGSQIRAPSVDGWPRPLMAVDADLKYFHYGGLELSERGKLVDVFEVRPRAALLSVFYFPDAGTFQQLP